MKTKTKKSEAKSSAAPVAASPVSQSPVISAIRTLSQKVMVLAVSISCFSGSKKDKVESARIATDKDVAAGSVRVWKSLLRHKKTAAAMTAAQHLRQRFYALTVPWGEDGKRAVPIGNAIAAKLELEGLKTDFLKAAADAIADLPAMIAEDQKNTVGLGGMFCAADYPSQAEFAARFGCTIRLLPVQSDDFRNAALSPAEIAEINQAVAEEGKRLAAEANRDLLERLKESLQKVTGNLAAGKGIYEKTFANIGATCAEVAALNIAENPAIATLASVLATQWKDSETLADLVTSDAGKAAIKHDAETRLAEIEKAMAAFA